jgi:hypothetical protein
MSGAGTGRWPVAMRDEDFEGQLVGVPPETAQLFWRFIKLARACGEVTFEIQRSRVVLRGSKRIFASVQVRGVGLAGHINLARKLPVRGLIRKSEPLTKKIYFHAFTVTSSGDLDEKFGQLLCEAHAVGDGAASA